MINIKRSELKKNFFNIGVSKKIRNYENISHLIETPQGIDMFNINKIELNLKKSIELTSNIIAKRGSVLLYSPLVKIKEGRFKKYLKNKWKRGFISNFKVGNDKEKFPHFLIIMENNNKVQKTVENEALRVSLPTLVISNSNNNKTGFYSVGGNNSNKIAVNYMSKVFATAIYFGHLQEVAQLSDVSFS